MTDSTKLLAQIRKKYSKKLDLSHERMLDLLNAVGNPHHSLPQVVHIAGSHNKENVLLFLKDMLSAAGYTAHLYKSSHLYRYHERIGLDRENTPFEIAEELLVDVLNQTIESNNGEPITFFEIFTVAAMLAFAECPADYLLMSSGAGGRQDPTNVIDEKILTIITSVSEEQAARLETSLTEATLEYSGIMRGNTPCIVGYQSLDTSVIIENYADELHVPLHISGQDWMVHEQHGRLVYQDQSSLLDLPLPNVKGPHQINNAGIALAACRQLTGDQLSENEYSSALKSAKFPGQLQPLTNANLLANVEQGSEIWVDSGSSREDALVIAQAMADFEEKVPNPLHLVLCMRQDSDVLAFLSPFQGLTEFIATIQLPDLKDYYPAQDLANIARAAEFNVAPQAGLVEALQTSRSVAGGSSRILICGSMAFAGHVLHDYG